MRRSTHGVIATDCGLRVRTRARHLADATGCEVIGGATRRALVDWAPSSVPSSTPPRGGTCARGRGGRALSGFSPRQIARHATSSGPRPQARDLCVPPDSALAGAATLAYHYWAVHRVAWVAVAVQSAPL